MLLRASLGVGGALGGELGAPPQVRVAVLPEDGAVCSAPGWSLAPALCAAVCGLPAADADP